MMEHVVADARHAAPTRGYRPLVLFTLYLIIPLSPLLLAWLELMPGRGFAVNFSVALGFVALAVLGLQAVLAARMAWIPFTFPALLAYHRQMALLAVGASFAHPIILFLTNRRYLRLLDVQHAPLRAQLGWTAVILLVVLIITTLWRRTLRLSYPAWQVTHSLLAASVVVTAGLHTVGVGYYTGDPLILALWAVYGVAFVWLALWVRVLRPLHRGLHPWRVEAVFPEPGGGLTVTVAPAYRRDKKFRWKAGQFAWISLGNPWQFDYTPYTISSAPECERVEFTIQAVGPSSESMRRVRLGDRIYLDGPHGGFTVDDHPGVGYVFIATGVGITPFLSILQSLVERKDNRACWLFVGNRNERSVVGIRTLARVAGRPNIRVVHVISRHSPGWRGETGHISRQTLLRYLPRHARSLQFFVCSRPEIRKAIVSELSVLGIPARNVHVEDFG